VRTSTIVLIEIGMLAGIVVAGYALPGRTPLSTFLAAGGACFVIGNVLLFGKFNQVVAGDIAPKTSAWTHIFRALAILSVFWLLSLLFLRR
jgi:hypothetical protein